MLLSCLRRLGLSRTQRPLPIRYGARLTLESLEDRCVPSGLSSITSNFNGTPIAAGASLWFNGVMK
jgi:hypothetical protein